MVYLTSSTSPPEKSQINIYLLSRHTNMETRYEMNEITVTAFATEQSIAMDAAQKKANWRFHNRLVLNTKDSFSRLGPLLSRRVHR